MTLKIYDVEQRSDEWYEARRGIITASTIGKLITPKTIQVANNPDSRRIALTLAAERITGWVEPVYMSDDMWRGVEEEPIARAAYAEHYAPVHEAGFMTEDKWGFTIGYSPDGLVGDDGAIEIKSRRPKVHLETIIADQPPTDCMAQLQCGLLVTGRAWIDYISYCGGMPLYVRRVQPDFKWFDALRDAAAVLEGSITDAISIYTGRVVGLPMTERTILDEIAI